MSRNHLSLTCALCLAAVTSVAQVVPLRPARPGTRVDAPPTTPAAPVAPGEAPAPPAGAQYSSLDEAVTAYAAGKPVPVVIFTGNERPSVSLKAPVSGLPVLQALDAIAAGASGGAKPVPGNVPNRLRAFRAGGVFTFAPEYDVAYNLDVSKKNLLNCLSANVAVQMLLRSLSREQVASAGAGGLGYDAMNATQQALWKSVLSVPYTLTRRVEIEGGGFRPEPIGEGGRTLNPETVRLRVHPVFRDLALPLPWQEAYQPSGQPLSPPLTASPEGGFTHNLNNRLSFDIAERVATKEKRSHLPETSPVMARPLNKTGNVPVGEFLALAGKTTGLRFLAPGLDETRTVWLGAPTITVMDGLKALALGAGGTWRRVGQTFFLVESLAGGAAEELALDESAAPMERDLAKLEESVGPWRWNDVVPALRADQAVAPGPTPEQLAAFTASEDGGDEVDPRRFIRFRDMTPAQQQAVREQAKTIRVYDPTRNQNVPVDPAWLEKARVRQLALGVFLDIRGVGAAELNGVYMDLGQARYQRFTARPSRPSAPPSAPKTVQLQQRMRAVAVAPMEPAEWDRLFAEMPKRGLNAVYVPVLWDGKAMLPTTAFPPQSARAEDLLSYVSKKAKASGIQAVGVIHVLSWRNPSPDPHWLDANIGWVELDALGRGRRRWALKFPQFLAGVGDYVPEWQRDPVLLADYVNPRVPEVRAKLLALAQALKKYPDLAGVALAHWSRGPYLERQADLALPPLGFHPSSREAFVRAFEVDPLDISTVSRSGNARSLDALARRGEDYALRTAWNRQRLLEDRLLLQTLQADLEQTWDGRVEAFVGPMGRNTYLDEASRPLADRVIAPASADGSRGVYALASPIASIPGLFTPDRKTRLETFARDLQNRAYNGGPGSGIILDFTSSPDLLWEGLTLVEKREQPVP